MDALLDFFYAVLLAVISFLLGYSIRPETIKQLKALAPKRRSFGAVFKPKTQEEIKKAQDKKFYENL